MRKLAVLLAVTLATGAIAPGQPVVVNEGTEAPECWPNCDPEKTVAVFIAQALFRDDVLGQVQRRLRMDGFDSFVVARESTIAVGMDRTIIKPHITLDALRPDDFAGLIFVGGSGTSLVWDDSLLHARCRAFDRAGKLVAAVGIAPVVLAKAGILDGRAATAYPDQAVVEYLREGGAKFRQQKLVRDGNVITADDCKHVREFALAVSAWLAGE